MVDTIKVAFNVGVHSPPTLHQRFFDHFDRLRCTASWPKAIEGISKVRFEDRLNHDAAVLLYSPISHRRNSQRTSLTIGLGNVNPQYRLRSVLPGLQISHDSAQKFLHTSTLHVFDGDPVYPGTPTIPTHFFPGPPQYIGPEYTVIERMKPSVSA